MLGNFKYIPKKFRVVYGFFLAGLFAIFITLVITRPSKILSIGILLVLYLVDIFFLTRSKEKIYLPLLGDSLLFFSWMLLLYVY